MVITSCSLECKIQASTDGQPLFPIFTLQMSLNWQSCFSSESSSFKKSFYKVGLEILLWIQLSSPTLPLIIFTLIVHLMSHTDCVYVIYIMCSYEMEIYVNMYCIINFIVWFYNGCCTYFHIDEGISKEHFSKSLWEYQFHEKFSANIHQL